MFSDWLDDEIDKEEIRRSRRRQEKAKDKAFAPSWIEQEEV